MLFAVKSAAPLSPVSEDRAALRGVGVDRVAVLVAGTIGLEGADNEFMIVDRRALIFGARGEVGTEGAREFGALSGTGPPPNNA